MSGCRKWFFLTTVSVMLTLPLRKHSYWLPREWEHMALGTKTFVPTTHEGTTLVIIIIKIIIIQKIIYTR